MHSEAIDVIEDITWMFGHVPKSVNMEVLECEEMLMDCVNRQTCQMNFNIGK